jgi:hypothetical protein
MIVNFIYKKAKSRSDYTLLTVDFNLRSRNITQSAQVPQGRHDIELKVSSLRDSGAKEDAHIRRLRFASPTVNKVLSHAGHFTIDSTV